MVHDGMSRKLVCIYSGLAVIGLALSNVEARGQGLGRLFTTPEERQMLEALRREPPAESQPQVADEAPPEPAPMAVPGVTVNGVVYRSRGNNTVWVNGVNSFDGDLGSQQVNVSTRGQPRPGVAVQLPRGRPGALLKPGQTLDTAAGQVTDLYQREPEEDETPASR
jgi:hypothetical protein